MRTDKQIVTQTNKLAHLCLQHIGTGFYAPKDHKFYLATDPRSKTAWQMACDIQILMTDTDPNDALSALDEEISVDTSGHLRAVADFLRGFEGDEMQEGIVDKIQTVNTAYHLLRRGLEAWENEEESVQDEHAALITDLRTFLKGQ